MSESLKLPSIEARTASTLVAPATPLPPMPSSARDQPGDEGPVTVGVVDVGAAAGGVVGAADVRVEIGMADVHARVDDRHAASRAAAGGRERGGGADLVVGPRVGDACVLRIGCVEGVGRALEPAVAFDVGDAGIVAQGAGERRAGGDAGREHAQRVDGLHARAEAGEPGAQTWDVRVRARPDEHVLPVRPPGDGGRGDSRAALRQRQSQLCAARAGACRRAEDGAQRLALVEPVRGVRRCCGKQRQRTEKRPARSPHADHGSAWRPAR